MKTDANFSNCRKYRYALWRIWDESKPYAMFIGLNPSTADETENDPTINRCINYSKDWGYGGLCMVNLFAFRATAPSDMMASNEPIGSDNDEWIKNLGTEAGVIIAAWGNDGSYLERSKEVRQMIPDLMCLKINKSGEPAHPLYQPGTAKPIKWAYNNAN
ncbi:DUF1643 domain-containing protein [uncultured Amphritea sp.]|uniref:DUF1643 domain-containing protein n=1 Tax=uncultured Amphritea sp. TaxID=981605 RepID=UPI0025D91D87|nr:DUF1643 domain-containing protein [uncultured Amphritea sp.]